MRIISKKKDYYDCIMAHDQDHEPLYIREPVQIDMREAFGGLGRIFPSIWGASLPPKCSAFRQHVIGFCGNIYPALEFERGEQQTFCYSAESVDAWFRENLNAAAFNQLVGVWFDGFGLPTRSGNLCPGKPKSPRGLS